MSNTDKLREFGQKVMREYGRWWGVEAKDADKFVSDLTALLEQHKEVMCKQCKEQHGSFTYPGRPDPRDVSPYDIRSVHRARNPRKRT